MDLGAQFGPAQPVPQGHHLAVAETAQGALHDQPLAQGRALGADGGRLRPRTCRRPQRQEVPRAFAEAGVVGVLGVDEQLVTDLALGHELEAAGAVGDPAQAPAPGRVGGDLEVLVGDLGARHAPPTRTSRRPSPVARVAAAGRWRSRPRARPAPGS